MVGRCCLPPAGAWSDAPGDAAATGRAPIGVHAVAVEGARPPAGSAPSGLPPAQSPCLLGLSAHPSVVVLGLVCAGAAGGLCWLQTFQVLGLGQGGDWSVAARWLMQSHLPCRARACSD